MKHWPLYETPQQVLEELRSLQERNVPLLMRIAKQQPKFLQIREIQDRNEPPLVQADKRARFDATIQESFWYIYRTDGRPRGFCSVVIGQSLDQLVFSLPETIYQIQRRRHKRVAVPSDSRGTLIVLETRKIVHCTPTDLSLGGVRLSGNFPAEMRQGLLLGNITLQLYQKTSRKEAFNLILSEAVVTWAKEANGLVSEIGVQFNAAAAEQTKLSSYLQLRDDEEAALIPAPGTPSAIAVNERRRNERVAPTDNSEIVFAIPGSSKMVKAAPHDISMDGARLTGSFSSTLRPGMLIGPLTFHLFRMLDKQECTTIHVGEATIVWERPVSGEKKQLGLRLQLPAKEQDKLAHYIQVRSMEMLMGKRKPKA